MKDYFVVVYNKDTENPKVLDVKFFLSLEKLFKWMESNKEELFCVNEANPILDYS
jgi:hypothetical protein